MRILTYKRTHTGDPDCYGRFGINDCMGAVRNRHFDAVIGVGGIGAEQRSYGIAGKLTWIGVGPRRSKGRRGDIVTFEHFLLLDAEGPELLAVAPNLARRVYGGRVRVLLDGYSPAEHAEALNLLKWARKALRKKTTDSGVGPRFADCPTRGNRLKGCRRACD
ncbi:hypothetical protein [Burkholderia metallica]|uniref:hypothetical protein n=1 Tax=Burkholderia metallica TaxID=488729 RepID=UPI001CF36782|nr:hypothetical protein [Burkholderia metallica]MCA8002749.1 hypothetical protein [Burkholderia metallica]